MLPGIIELICNLLHVYVDSILAQKWSQHLFETWKRWHYIDGQVQQDCSNSSVLAVELVQNCPQPVVGS